MKMRLCRFLPKGWSITIWPLGSYTSDIRSITNERIINHEKIHWVQQVEMFILGMIIATIVGVILFLLGVNSPWLAMLLAFPPLFFYIWYGIEWIIKLLTPPVGAYDDLGFEREAYENDQDLNYLPRRKYFSWFKRIKNQWR